MPIDDAPLSDDTPESGAQPPANSSISTHAMTLGLFVGILLVYLPSLGNGFVYDDASMIQHRAQPDSLMQLGNAVKEMASGLPYYRPVTWSTFLIQKWLHGDSPAAFHFVNALLMAATGCLAFVFLQAPAFRINRGCAFSAAALFAVHPVTSACVYPAASGREALLAAFFMLASVCAFLRPGINWYTTALLALLTALFSREQAIVLPVIFLIADVLKLSRNAPGRDLRKWLSRYLPIALVVVGWFAARWMLFSGSEFQLAIISSPATPLYSLAFAVQSIFAPFLALHYEPALADWLNWPRLLFAFTGIGVLLAAIPRSESETRRVAIFWLIWFLLVFLPTANILKQETEFDERYVLLSLLSVTALTATLVSHFHLGLLAQKRLHWSGFCLITTCVCLTVYRSGFYADNLKFYTSWTQSSPDSARAWHNLANAQLARGGTNEAIESFQQSVQLDPDFTASHFDLAQTAAAFGNDELAVEHYRIVIELEPVNGQAHLYLGNVLFRQGKVEEATQHLRTGVRSLPDSAVAHNSLGVALRRGRNLSGASYHLEEAIKLDPDSADAYFNLGEVLTDSGRPNEARNAFEQALSRVPPNSWKAQNIRQRLSEPHGSNGLSH